MKKMKKTSLLTVTATAMALCLGACTPTMASRGNLLEDYQLESLKPGIDTQYDVMKKVGSPTTKAPFDDNIWYYLGQETEKKGVFDPKITKERIVVLSFNKEGLLMEAVDVPPNRNDLPYTSGKTPTSGSEVTVMQQLLGNMGKFNKDKGPANSASTGGGTN